MERFLVLSFVAFAVSTSAMPANNGSSFAVHSTTQKLQAEYQKSHEISVNSIRPIINYIPLRKSKTILKNSETVAAPIYPYHHLYHRDADEQNDFDADNHKTVINIGNNIHNLTIRFGFPSNPEGDWMTSLYVTTFDQNASTVSDSHQDISEGKEQRSVGSTDSSTKGSSVHFLHPAFTGSNLYRVLTNNNQYTRDEGHSNQDIISDKQEIQINDTNEKVKNHSEIRSQLNSSSSKMTRRNVGFDESLLLKDADLDDSRKYENSIEEDCAEDRHTPKHVGCVCGVFASEYPSDENVPLMSTTLHNVSCHAQDSEEDACKKACFASGGLNDDEICSLVGNAKNLMVYLQTKMCEDDSSWNLVGFTSFGLLCCFENAPTICETTTN